MFFPTKQSPTQRWDYFGRKSTALAMTELNLTCILHTILKQLQSASTRFAAGVAWMLPVVNMILRVRHESEHVALWVADASNVENGTIWVDGVVAVCGRAVRVDVGEGDLI